jgi:transcriptional regulator with XRE-family HTH domain
VPVTKQKLEHPQDFGITTREFREIWGVDLKQLADRAQISVPMLSQFERGNRRLSPDTKLRLLLAMQEIEEERTGERDTFAGKFIRLMAAGKEDEAEKLASEKHARDDAAREVKQKKANNLEAYARAIKILGWVESLERAQSQVNDPVLSEIILSFRNEIAELEQQNADLRRRLAEDED